MDTFRRLDLWPIAAGLFFIALGARPPVVAFKGLAALLAVLALIFAIRVGSGRDRVLNAIYALATLAFAGAALLYKPRPLDGWSRALFVVAGVASLAAPLIGVFRRGSVEPVVNGEK